MNNTVKGLTPPISMLPVYEEMIVELLDKTLALHNEITTKGILSLYSDSKTLQEELTNQYQQKELLQTYKTYCLSWQTHTLNMRQQQWLLTIDDSVQQLEKLNQEIIHFLKQHTTEVETSA